MKKFEMTQEQLDKIINECRPVVMIALQYGKKSSLQENVNNARESFGLGMEIGFEHMTVRPIGKGGRFFMAESTNDK